MATATNLLASNIANDVSKDDHTRSINPVILIQTIVTVLQFILTLFNAGNRVNKSVSVSDVKKSAMTANLIQRALIKIRLNHFMKQQDPKSYKVYLDHQDNIVKNTLSHIGNTDDSQLGQVISELK